MKNKLYVIWKLFLSGNYIVISTKGQYTSVSQNKIMGNAFFEHAKERLEVLHDRHNEIIKERSENA